MKNDRICPLWNNDRNSFKIHAGFFKISVYHTIRKFKLLAKLTERQILPVEGDTGGKFSGCK